MMRNDRYRVRLWAGLLVVAVVAGCAAGTRSPEPLANAVRLYNDGVRWQRFEQAAQKRPPAQRDDFLDERDQVHEDLRIHDYEVVRVRYGPDRLQARVQVKYSWYLDSRGVVHETHAVQRWEHHDGLWTITGETRLRGTPMPGLAEPAGAGEADASGEPDESEEPDASGESGDEPASEQPGEDSGALPTGSP